MAQTDTLHIETLQPGVRPSRVRDRDTRPDAKAGRYWFVIAALFAAAALIRHVVAANTDVSWLLTAGERLLDGQRLYRDIIETNPPMAVLTYLPGIVIARVTGLSAEIVIDVLLFLAIAVSLVVAGNILKGSSVVEKLAVGPFLCMAVAVLAVLPTQTFAQREHIAVLGLLPALAVLALRGRGENPPRWAIASAGLGLGLALAFKPHFAIAIVSVVGVLAWTSKSWRLFVAPEFFIAAAIVAVYVAGIVWFFPDYFTIVGPMVRDVYLPVGLSMTNLLRTPGVSVWGITLAAALWMRPTKIDTSFLLLTATSIGFAVVFFVQRKGWPYHSYPMLAFAVLALGYVIARRHDRSAAQPGIPAMVLFAALFVAGMSWFNQSFDARPLQAVVARYGPHPTILSITGEPGIGHPLTRALDGIGVSRQQGLWVAGYYNHQRRRGALDTQAMAMMETYAARERDWLIADFRARPPTVILVDNLTDDWGAWIKADPEVSALLEPYTRKETFDGIDILSKPK